jgi:ferritin-like metal-binding protein YciE
MFERLKTPDELFNYKLGAALKMERTVLEMLESNASEAQDGQVAELFRHHHRETHEQLANLERVFAIFGWEVDDSPCPAIEGIQKEGKANAKKTDDALVDVVLLSGAAETEHHEIAVYHGLITQAQALGHADAIEPLRRNLEQEQHTLEEVEHALEQMVARVPSRAS